ncbi:L,D-transpeptidase family protein [Azospirillum sp. ST 5-10]|uniref:L,D-transpeptidase family protein n=1 Tax=unclassified Azospirillum TaxID=2630922 RepID=UPI003F4A2703
MTGGRPDVPVPEIPVPEIPVPEILVLPDGWLRWPGGEVRCTLGRGGVRRDKREGDGATPAGRFPLRRVLWRADRLPRPETGLPTAAIAPADGWCDDPGDPAYNRPVTLPYPGRHERMWRDDHVYDLVVVLGHNDDPVVPGRGSAVFMHLVHPGGTPTAGCVALAGDALLALLRDCGPASVLRIDSPA